MSNTRPDDVVTAVCGAGTVTGVVVYGEQGALWIETSDGHMVRFAILPECACRSDPETSH